MRQFPFFFFFPLQIGLLLKWHIGAITPSNPSVHCLMFARLWKLTHPSFRSTFCLTAPNFRMLFSDTDLLGFAERSRQKISSQHHMEGSEVSQRQYNIYKKHIASSIEAVHSYAPVFCKPLKMDGECRFNFIRGENTSARWCSWIWYDLIIFFNKISLIVSN